MSILDRLRQTDISPLGRQFARFCEELDKTANDLALITAAVLAHRNTHGDTCLEMAALAGQPLLEFEDGTSPVEAPELDRWTAALGCNFVGEPGDYRPLILDGPRLYLHRHWQEEQVIAGALKSRFDAIEYDHARLGERLDALFATDSPASKEGAYGQKLAAAMALTSRLAIITGGPGTGKTTTVTKILALLLEQEPKMRILLAAPTGKAAARLSESITGQVTELKGEVDNEILERLPREASTIHRLLGWQREGFEHHADNPLPCDCLLLDETSMVDQGLMASLLSALPEACRIIMLGDRDQLSSVEAGSVFGDLTGNGRKPAISRRRAREISALMGGVPPDIVDDLTPDIADHIAQLNYSYRFSSGGGIGKLAGAVNSGNSEKALELLEGSNSELRWLKSTGHQPGESIIDRALTHYRGIFAASSASDALKAFESVRILTALREGPCGEQEIRKRLENRLMREGLSSQTSGAPYKGLPLIIRRNDRETGLFNGDTGIFWPDGNDDIMAWFRTRDGLKPFTLHQLPEWQPAWVLTVHRSQGSEYDQVFLVLPSVESPVVTRELIYTGITRAISHCTIVSDTRQFLSSIQRTVERFSGLSEKTGWRVLDKSDH